MHALRSYPRCLRGIPTQHSPRRAIVACASLHFAVRGCRTNGVFNTWEDVCDACGGVPGAVYRSFDNQKDAKNWMTEELPEWVDESKLKKWYAVSSGRKLGLFVTWEDTYAQTNKFSGSWFKSFTTRQAAEEWLQEQGVDNAVVHWFEGF